MQRPWISPCMAAVITAPYTSTHLRRRKMRRRRRQMKDRGKHFTAASPPHPPRSQPIKAAVSFGSPIKQFGLQQQRKSCHGNGHQEVGVRMREWRPLCSPRVVSVASLWDWRGDNKRQRNWPISFHSRLNWFNLIRTHLLSQSTLESFFPIEQISLNSSSLDSSLSVVAFSLCAESYSSS